MRASILDRTMLVAAFGLLGFAAFRQLVPGGGPGGQPAARSDLPVSASAWKTISTVEPVGGSGGQANAAPDHTVVVFSDFECPMCKRFEQLSLTAARKRFGDELAVVYRHWPLTYHAGARTSAIAAECARTQDAFSSMAAELFEAQPTLSHRKEFWTLAANAGVRDSTAFADCLESPGPLQVLARDSALRALLPREPTGTPTILVDGIMLGRVPSPEQLVELLGRPSASLRSPHQ